MSAERDEEQRVRELGELYRRLVPPPLADGLDEADAETARAVRWMQAAWRDLEVPPARLPVGRVRPPRARLVRRVLPWLAAAGLLAAGSALLRKAQRSARESGRDELVSTASVVIEDVRSDRLELRSGPVRLVLLSPPERQPTPTDPDSTGG